MWKHKNFINLQLYAGETWVLNETLTTQSYGIEDVVFSSNGTTYSKFARYYKTDFLGEVEQDYVAYYTSETASVTVYSRGTWTDQAYRIITFATAPTGDLLTWLQANGTKQSTPKLPTPTNVSITGTTVQWDEVANATSYDVLVDGEVWENVPKPITSETWVLNETLTLTSNTFSANFTANNSTYTEIWMSDRELAYGDSGNVVYATKGGWIDEANKTLVFATAPTGDLLTWLQANGTKQ